MSEVWLQTRYRPNISLLCNQLVDVNLGAQTVTISLLCAENSLEASNNYHKQKFIRFYI